MTPKVTPILFGLPAILALAGCVNTTPVLDHRFGMAVNQAIVRQTLNPEAAGNGATVAGIDGKAAVSTTDRYLDSFKEPPPTMNVINIGGSLAGAQ